MTESDVDIPGLLEQLAAALPPEGALVIPRETCVVCNGTGLSADAFLRNASAPTCPTCHGRGEVWPDWALVARRISGGASYGEGFWIHALDALADAAELAK